MESCLPHLTLSFLIHKLVGAAVKGSDGTLTSMAQVVGHHPAVLGIAEYKVAGLIPGQGTCPDQVVG